MSERLKQQIIGTYVLGFQEVQVVAREGTGGEFYACPGQGKCLRIKVGMECDWPDAFESLLHEVMELQLVLSHTRYMNTSRWSPRHDDYNFMFDHVVFTDVCSKAGKMLVELIPAFSGVWAKWDYARRGREREAKEKRKRKK